MKRFDNLGFNEVQCDCTGSFTEILPHLARGQREYGQSVDWRTPESNHTALGRFVFSSLAYHPRSVITRSLAFEAGAWKRILSLKLSERVSHARHSLAGAFSSFASFLLFLFTVDLRLSPSEPTRTANPKGTNRKPKWKH